MGKKHTRTADAALAGKLVTGIGKRFANVGQLTLAGRTFTPAQVTDKLERLVTLRANVNAAKAALRVAVAAEAAEAPSLRDFMVLFVALVMATFAGLADVLLDFGLAPKKVAAPRTAEQTAAANAKREATRAARKVMGSRQRKAVKGDVTGVIITPEVAAQPGQTSLDQLSVRGGPLAERQTQRI
jgi:hypothetical protein